MSGDIDWLSWSFQSKINSKDENKEVIWKGVSTLKGKSDRFHGLNAT